MALRGVVEGFYGPPWSHENRLDMIRWMGAHGMNFYVHAPKDDVYGRLRWREPYPDSVMAEFAEEIEEARGAGVAWAFNLSPGRPLFDAALSRDICFACPEDFELLVAKYQRLDDLGVSAFMLSFDDAIKASSHPEDAAAFGVGDEAFGAMNGDLANRLRERFPDSLVVLVPADYSGTVQTPYLKGLGEVLDDRILVGWTGPAVVSVTVTGDEARAFGDAITRPGMPRRKPIIWDNFPANDLSGNAFAEPAVAGVGPGVRLPITLKLPSGPVKGRGADLPAAISGFLSNPMAQAQASKVPLATVAAYLDNPLSYTDEPVACPHNTEETTRAGCLSEGAWLAGISELGGVAAGPLLSFVNQMRSTALDRVESPVFEARWQQFADDFVGPFWTGSWLALLDELTAESQAPAALRTASAPSPGFLQETEHHLDQLTLNTEAGLQAVQMLEAERPHLEISVVRRERRQGHAVVVEGTVAPADAARVHHHEIRLGAAEVAMRARPYSVHGDRVDTDLSSVHLLENRMDEFLEFARAATAAWRPLAPLATAGPLSVTVAGEPVTVMPDGTFTASVDVPAARRTIPVVVTDSAGMQTGEVVRISGLAPS